jgi:hypothetical protein
MVQGTVKLDNSMVFFGEQVEPAGWVALNIVWGVRGLMPGDPVHVYPVPRNAAAFAWNAVVSFAVYTLNVCFVGASDLTAQCALARVAEPRP